MDIAVLIVMVMVNVIVLVVERIMMKQVVSKTEFLLTRADKQRLEKVMHYISIGMRNKADLWDEIEIIMEERYGSYINN